MNEHELEAKHQKDLGKRFELGWWYGTRCTPCEGVLPKILFEYKKGEERCYYECPVCGKRTESFQIPLQAEEAWNAGRFKTTQLKFFTGNVL